jgi:hypothetical protein
MNLQSLVEINDSLTLHPVPVGAAEGCDLLILIFSEDQKIAAFGSSYRGNQNPANALANRFPRAPAAKSITV